MKLVRGFLLVAALSLGFSSVSLGLTELDDFSSISPKWTLDAQIVIKDGEMSVKGNKLVLRKDLDTTKATVKVKTRVVSDTNPKPLGYGLDFRIQDNSDRYSFMISRSGYYQLVKYHAGGSQILVLKAWTQAGTIQTAAGSANVLEVRVDGDKLHLLVNDQHLDTVTDASYAKGAAGLFVSQNQEVAFDDFFFSTAVQAPTAKPPTAPPTTPPATPPTTPPATPPTTPPATPPTTPPATPPTTPPATPPTTPPATPPATPPTATPTTPTATPTTPPKPAEPEIETMQTTGYVVKNNAKRILVKQRKGRRVKQIPYKKIDKTKEMGEYKRKGQKVEVHFYKKGKRRFAVKIIYF